MRFIVVIIFSIAINYNVVGQNCKAFLYSGDTLQYEACLIAEERHGHYQFSWEYQNALERSVEHCTYFSYAYRHMSVAYLKSGDFINWKRMMDKAVKYAPLDNLGYRGWCRYQFFRDYGGAIEDIERLDSLTTSQIGYSAGGEYHLNIARALCYKAIGEKTKAIQIIEGQLSQQNYSPGAYDHLHLGVLYMEVGRLEDALDALDKQLEINDIAECNYYKALILKAMGKEYMQLLAKARSQYLFDNKMLDYYSHQEDKIYLRQIEEALKL